jgi:uracil-DNA glycosylase
MYSEGKVIYMETNYTQQSGTMNSNIGTTQKRLHCTRSQGKHIFPCFNPAPRVKSTLTTERSWARQKFLLMIRET